MLDTHKLLCELTHMATNIELNEKLLQRAMKLGGKKTKKDAVNEALKEYVQRRDQLEILDMFGTVVYEEGHDYKTQRKQS